jgi:hypothetical protein
VFVGCSFKAQDKQLAVIGAGLGGGHLPEAGHRHGLGILGWDFILAAISRITLNTPPDPILRFVGGNFSGKSPQHAFTCCGAVA